MKRTSFTLAYIFFHALTWINFKSSVCLCVCVCVKKETTKRGRELPCKRELSPKAGELKAVEVRKKIFKSTLLKILKCVISEDGKATGKEIKCASTVAFIFCGYSTIKDKLPSQSNWQRSNYGYYGGSTWSWDEEIFTIPFTKL